MHWTHRIGEESIRMKQSLFLAALKNWAVVQPTYRVCNDLQQTRGNEMGSIRSWFKRLLSHDHRQGERLEAPLLVAYYWDGSIPTAHKIRDISSTGFYLLTTERWHLGTIVTMTLQRSDTAPANPSDERYISVPSDERYISVQSKVVRLGEDGVGFAFVPVESKGSGATQASRRVQTSKSKVADKKALSKFLDHLKLDDGCLMIGWDRRVKKETLLGQDGSLRMPGENGMNRLKDESGQSLVIAALAMTCLMGFVALATDVGIMLRQRTLVQTAADSGAIAGASELNFGNAATAAQAATAQNGFTNGVNGATVTVHTPPSSGSHQHSGFVEVIVSQSQSTVFMNLFGRSAMTIAARAVATNAAPNSGCIYTLGTSGVDISGSGGATLSDTGCGIIDNSSSANALTLSGGASISVQSIGIVGGANLSGGATTNPTPVTGIAPVSDPLAFLALSAPSYNPATLSCAAGINVSGGHTQTVAPGGSVACYNGASVSGGSTLNITNPGVIVINGNLNLSGGSTANFGAGLYYITGTFSASGGNSANGTGVTFFAAGPTGSVDLSGGATLNLTAPVTGTYNGILFWEAQGDNQAVMMSGGAGSVLKGIVYAPSAQLQMSGGAGSQFYTDAVVKSIALSGGASLLSYATVNGNSPLAAVSLVE
jgi:Flp pilus assembly protein TadG